MAAFIPWRVKNFISEQCPLVYHLVANGFRNQNSIEHWDAMLARTWDEPNRDWPVKVARIAEVLPPDTKLVDIGCGTGSMLRALRTRGFTDLHGLELSAYAVARLAREGIPMTRGSLLNMPFPDAAFDAAIASEVLEHVIRRRRFLRELTRIVKAGGAVLIFVPDDYLGPIEEPEHVIKYNAASLRKFLARFLCVDSVTSMIEPHTRARSLLAVCHKGVEESASSGADPSRRRWLPHGPTKAVVGALRRTAGHALPNA